MESVAIEVDSMEQEVVIGLGSNVGNRLNNFIQALQMMKSSGIRITRHSCLYETAPVHVTNQPKFLNAAVRGFTNLEPQDLLKTLKKIEKDMGRPEDGIRYGPRPLDLDILFYGTTQILSDNLTIPHEKIWERSFVLAPLADLLGSFHDNETVKHWHSFYNGGIFKAWERLGGESLIGQEDIQRVFPIGDKLIDFSKKSYVMGILNITPDSFSDGGHFQSIDSVVSRVREMIFEGVDIIDIGAQSTRPMASRISSEEELERLIPILEAIRGMPEMEGKLISVDTFDSKVALEAISKGADIINDVSLGSLDANILKVVAENSRVCYIGMHMRGDPCTMQTSENLEYNDVVKEVASEVYFRLKEAEVLGLEAWRVMVDPGIGFSKEMDHNLELIMGLGRLREELGKMSVAMSHLPLVLGVSRKRFLGDICERCKASERDCATMACVSVGVLGGANVVRVHNVGENVDAVKVCDAMMRRRRSRIFSSLME